jgi:hypothetical protein
MVGGRSKQALVSQLAEETDSKPVQCEFESHRGHQKHQLRAHIYRDTINGYTRQSAHSPQEDLHCGL